MFSLFMSTEQKAIGHCSEVKYRIEPMTFKLGRRHYLSDIGFPVKGKALQFHSKKSLHSRAILKKFEFLRPFIRPLHSEKTKKIMFCFRTELKIKSLFTTTSNVLPFKFKCWLQNNCRVKWFPETYLVSLSHL